MGWIFFHKPNGKKAIETIKEQCGAEWIAKHFVAASATRDAVHIVAKFHDPDSKVYVPDPDGTVRAILVYAIKSVPSDPSYNFGYKDMTETMGPYGHECAPSIISAASPLRPKEEETGEYSQLRSAREYRERSLSVSAAKSKKRTLKVGARVKLAEPLSFGGVMLDEFVVVRCRLRGRKGISTVFRSIKTGGLCGIRAADIGRATVTEVAA